MMEHQALPPIHDYLPEKPVITWDELMDHNEVGYCASDVLVVERPGRGRFERIYYQLIGEVYLSDRLGLIRVNINWDNGEIV